MGAAQSVSGAISDGGVGSFACSDTYWRQIDGERFEKRASHPHRFPADTELQQKNSWSSEMQHIRRSTPNRSFYTD
jgi:hypothetical protein